MKAHEVTEIRFRDEELIVVADGQERAFLLADVSPRLAAASPQERECFEVSPCGYGVHWPLLDEDLSIDGLFGITHRPAPPKPHAAAQRAPRAQATP
jgi:NAD(P)H-hydrate repair Nnr-like enzyme with NAD(P)H-hydrate epimerase domain